MADTSDPLLREVDEALRQDQLRAAWKKFRWPVILFVGVIVFGSLGETQWRNYELKKAGEAMQELAVAQKQFNDGHFDAAAIMFEDIATHNRGLELRDLARVWQGKALAQAGKTADAVTAFEAVAERPQSKELIWRDLACLRLVALDETKSACLEAMDASPLGAQRALTRAALLWDHHKSDEARSILTTLVNNPDTPSSVRANAQQYLSVIAPVAH